MDEGGSVRRLVVVVSPVCCFGWLGLGMVWLEDPLSETHVLAERLCGSSSRRLVGWLPTGAAVLQG